METVAQKTYWDMAKRWTEETKMMPDTYWMLAVQWAKPERVGADTYWDFLAMRWARQKRMTPDAYWEFAVQRAEPRALLRKTCWMVEKVKRMLPNTRWESLAPPTAVVTDTLAPQP